MSGERAEEQLLTGELLKAVSRSFYLTIRWLPSRMRDGVALGYLLARATDSVADTSTADADTRADILRRMAAAVRGTLTPPALQHLLTELAETMAAAQTIPAERELLMRFGDCLDILARMPEGQRKLLRQVLDTISEGQVWDIEYFRTADSVGTDEQTREYTYRVAGCVGLFWTELGLLTMGADFCAPERREIMCRAGIRYGCGLQLVNILRDRAEDAARGRSYLCSDPQKWLNRAEHYLDDGLDYSTRLRTFRLRFASMLPALIGIKTLRALRRAPQVQRVRIPRRAVYACLLRAAWLSIFRRAF